MKYKKYRNYFILSTIGVFVVNYISIFFSGYDKLRIIVHEDAASLEMQFFSLIFSGLGINLLIGMIFWILVLISIYFAASSIASLFKKNNNVAVVQTSFLARTKSIILDLVFAILLGCAIWFVYLNLMFIHLS